jgi:hypothetical protein
VIIEAAPEDLHSGPAEIDHFTAPRSRTMTGAIRKTVTEIPTRVEHTSSHLFAPFPQLGTAFRLGSAERYADELRRLGGVCSIR